jgi:hypothetical protein
MAVHVVDHLEAIKIEHENGQSLRFAEAAKIFIEFFGEKAAVRQPSQGVVPRQIVCL